MVSALETFASSLISVELRAQIPDAWRVALQPVEEQLAVIERHLASAQSEGDLVIPDQVAIFKALELDPQDVRVIIIGQDPYPNPDHAMGLSFSVPPGTTPLPPSLRNIIREIESDVGMCEVANGDLEPWVKQGVLLLNRSLTTCAGRSGVHAGIGWREVTDHIVRHILAIKPDAIGVLWGNSAQELAHHFNPDLLIQSVHPSPLSAHRGFFGSRCFSRTNTLLELQGNNSIIW